MTQPYKFRIVHYRFNSEQVDMSDVCTDVSITQSLQQPWETISATYQLPRPRQFNGSFDAALRASQTAEQDQRLQYKMPVVGDWVVVFDDAYRMNGTQKSRALAWGYVTNVSGGIEVDTSAGTIATGTVGMTAVSWLALLGRTRVVKAPGVLRTRGTLISPDDWGPFIEAVTDAQSPTKVVDGKTQRKDLGASLEKMLAVVAPLDMPVELGGGFIAEEYEDRETFRATGGVLKKTRDRAAKLYDQIKVVHDRSTGEKYAPNLPVDPVPGWSVRAVQSFNQPSATALQLIQGTFGGDPNMVELFPALTEPGITEEAVTSSDVAWRSPKVSLGGESVGQDSKLTFGALNYQHRTKKEFLDDLRRTSAEILAEQRNSKRVPELATAAAEVLNANPVLVYRMRPWRELALEKYISRNDTFGRGRTSKDLDDDIFQGVTWRAKKGSVRTYKADDLFSVDYEWDDANHINCVTVGLPSQADSAIRWIEQAGLPLIAPTNPSYGGIVTQRGLRVFEPQWPFFPPFQDDNQGLSENLKTVALQAAQFMGAGDRFAAGSFSGRFDATLRPGMFIDLQLPLAGDGVTLRGYVESVSHTIQVMENGAVTATTSAAYSRGLFDEHARRPVQFRPITEES